MKTDAQLQKQVMQELEWEPNVTHPHIGVAVDEGIVTLTGHVPYTSEKSAAQRATERVTGVRGIANDIEVHTATGSSRTDDELARAAIHSMQWHSQIPHERLRIVVERGVITLTGEVNEIHQRELAESVARNLVGVKGVRNEIQLKTRAD
jgi:osmotically-inducible protein OsmY